MPRWSEQMTIKFVELYEEHELLWNAHDKHYTNKKARQSALEDIVDRMGIDGFTVDAAKNKIKSLRCTYNLEHQKILKSISYGAKPDEAYKPRIKWLSLMENVMSYANGFGDTLSIEVGDDEQPDILEIDTTELVSPSRSGSEPTTEPAPETTSYTEVHSRKRNASPPPSSNEKRLDFDKISETIAELKALNDCLTGTEPERHECDVFGNHISTQLKQLTPHSRILAEAEIQNILTKFRIADLQRAEDSIYR
ncbi:hypothetical protein LSTR_LSTR004916 [Laodelphax striatellus]|uniref:MADF domain-containing protein n=1 Tax=Laodelphax striatellus TaxID=195883 RepID=A0A482XNC2_LAOST|nr:hypothetical protein LSTR_LSTR004916 [Laodelphax striatellus]